MVPAMALPTKLMSPVLVLVVRLICPLLLLARNSLRSEMVILAAVIDRLFWVVITEGAGISAPVGNLPFTSTLLLLVMLILAVLPVVLI